MRVKSEWQELFESWFFSFRFTPVSASDLLALCEWSGRGGMFDLLSELGVRAAATRLGKELDRLARLQSIYYLKIDNEWKPVRIIRNLNGTKQRYRLDLCEYEPEEKLYTDLKQQEINWAGTLQMKRGDKPVTLNLSGTGKVEAKSIGNPHTARYKFQSPAGDEIHYVEEDRLSFFCKNRGLTPALMSMVARGVRRHHLGWTGERLGD